MFFEKHMFFVYLRLESAKKDDFFVQISDLAASEYQSEIGRTGVGGVKFLAIFPEDLQLVSKLPG